ncbi:class I SAM-dependent methyltransferase [Scleromatobacter humisilvae]|uniref:Class I SAM-dependent methyltransferase n=1 Tax=Scleromatobacter humisilvae TaxID=2897159 RepID=A0A9X1YJS2_9BURK|nr:class I SAM-dependent methyltransferase [Scleromatobacter humisilvae]MCK9686685.1 class I SAM-dependent methyltransferase [Scleromatobacter humisilvae]
MECPSNPAHAAAAPSDWVVRWTPLLPAGARVLDVACGHGRHVHWLAGAGHRVTAVDREPPLLAPLAGLATTITADLEANPWPLPEQTFDAVVVTNYLWRALFPALKAAVAPGGLLIYETFAQAHAALGRPRRPEFLLRPGELIEVLRERESPDAAGLLTSETWQVIAFEEGRLPARGDVPEREVQRIVARRGKGPPGHADLLAPPG